ncbi:unnamed protein product, partial [Adineta steineri]
MVPYEFRPNQVFDPKKHILDVVAKQYLEQATSDVHHLVPADVIVDGNCLYHSIVLLMNNPAVTWSELRAICRKSTFSELYEITALCNILKCNIRSIYPKIDLRDHTTIVNNTFMPLPPTVTNCEITILWSHTLNKNEVRIRNNSTWSPNHFVPLMSRLIQHERDNNNQLESVLATPEKKTLKNNAAIQIRIPEFQSSPSKRLRSEINIDTDSSQSIMSDTMFIQQQTTQRQSAGTEEVTLQDGINISHSISNANILPKIRNLTSSWPEPISRELKEGCLKTFLHRMSMSALAETTCAVYNIRSPMQKSKSVPVSKITSTELLKVSDETK